MVEAYKKMFTNYANFSARTSRRDFWLAYLMNIIVAFVLGLICGMIAGFTGIAQIQYLAYLYSLAILVPSLAMEIRRLHDINKSGWWLLIVFVPLIGAIWLLILLATATKNENNNYGEQL